MHPSKYIAEPPTMRVTSHDSATRGGFEDVTDAVVVLGRALDVLVRANDLAHRLALLQIGNTRVSLGLSFWFWRQTKFAPVAEMD